MDEKAAATVRWHQTLFLVEKCKKGAQKERPALLSCCARAIATQLTRAWHGSLTLALALALALGVALVHALALALALGVALVHAQKGMMEGVTLRRVMKTILVVNIALALALALGVALVRAQKGMMEGITRRRVRKTTLAVALAKERLIT